MAGGRGSGEASRDEIAGLLGDARLQAGMMLRFGLAALLAVPFWHAPALALWAGQGVGQVALFQHAGLLAQPFGASSSTGSPGSA